ncbi:DUF4405 domain-containing protein [Neobacillus mesonae]|uniref:DUF4405 domain-containing protein n=1 Tax=Neobacillus mesonae TaxID=1193713 RepID=UPI00203B5209|nr:DUF4405 domain-containing protein [Neobacillus mesonae]MCM3567276.1 DUF4405 domain-containing protein [Neobacillus mesonae]
MKKNYIKIVLDLLMAVTFVLLMNPRVLNGLPFHEIAGLVIGVVILVHIGLNYRWVINTTKKIFNPKLAGKTRFSFLLNILLLLSMATVIITGILISRVVLPDLAVQGGRSLRGLHGLSADAAVALAGLHIAVHWQWIMSICKKAFKTKEGKLRKGVLASVVLSLAILAGGMQWVSSTSGPAPDHFKQGRFEQFEQFDHNGTGDVAAPPQRIFSEDGREGEFHGREGHGRSSSPFLVILNYFAIWAAIIIPVYYIERRFFKKKRKTKELEPKASV